MKIENLKGVMWGFLLAAAVLVLGGAALTGARANGQFSCTMLSEGDVVVLAITDTRTGQTKVHGAKLITWAQEDRTFEVGP